MPALIPPAACEACGRLGAVPARSGRLLCRPACKARRELAMAAAAAQLVAVHDAETDETLWVTVAEAAAGMVRYARTLGPGSAACGEMERQALALLSGGAS